MKLKKWGWMVGISLLAVGLTACGGGNESASGGSQNNTDATSGGSVVNAETVYNNNCMSCHGADLEGKLGPNLQTIGAKKSKDEILAVIQNGSGGMPAFQGKISDEEIQALADWLAAKK